MLVSTAQIEVQNTRRISIGTSTTSCLANGGLQRTQSTMPYLIARSSALYFLQQSHCYCSPTWALNQHYTFLQQSHCYCSPTWALVLPTGFKMDTLYATPRMIQTYHGSPHGHPARQTQMLVIYHQPSQPHLVKRTVLVSIDSHVIALTLAASIICCAIIVR